MRIETKQKDVSWHDPPSIGAIEWQPERTYFLIDQGGNIMVDKNGNIMRTE